MPSHATRLYLSSSAVLWLIGAALLLVALTGRGTGWIDDFRLWMRGHDVAAAVACLLIAAAAWSFRGHSSGMPVRHVAWLGTIGGITTALLLSLVFLSGASDMLYMLPQGLIGIWVIAVCARDPTPLGTGVRVVGFIAGIGLVLIAIGFVMIALALGPALVALVDAHSIAVDPSDLASSMNSDGHLLLKAGSLLGLPTYPIWAWFVSASMRANNSLERTRER